jgi:5-formyltetrahydrofolate cyclo-ligase
MTIFENKKLERNTFRKLRDGISLNQRENVEKNVRLYIDSYVKGFYPWEEKPLTKDSEGILSPNNSSPLSYLEISMIFVPCLSVDKNLTRLGYGGGYFDKLRRDNDWRNVPCIGVLTSNCVSTIPLTRAEWDIPLSGFITEKEIFV